SCVHLHEDGEPRWRRARIGGPHMDEGVAILQSPNRSDVEIRCRPKFAARRREGGLKKIQAIYNGKSAPITMQGLARLREKPPAQEQWEQWKEQWKTMTRTMGNNGKNNAKNNGNGRHAYLWLPHRKTGSGVVR